MTFMRLYLQILVWYVDTTGTHIFTSFNSIKSQNLYRYLTKHFQLDIYITASQIL
jgi:hypothetical protein